LPWKANRGNGTGFRVHLPLLESPAQAAHGSDVKDLAPLSPPLKFQHKLLVNNFGLYFA
jgi:hypothetical protein